MARVLALEWDSREARVVVAQVRGTRAFVEHAFSIELAHRDGGQDSAPVDFGASLSGALASRRVGKVETLVAVGRTSIELKMLAVPPAPDEELPELVGFQAMREFHSLQDGWTLDFLPLPSQPDEPRRALAAAIAPELIQQIQERCASAELVPERLVLRPCAAASLLLRHEPQGAEQVALLVDLLAEEVDLTVIASGRVVLMRTVKLPGQSTAQDDHSWLVGEIRRTCAAAQNQLGGDRVEVVYLCGATEEYQHLGGTIQQSQGLAVRLFDPFAAVDVDRTLSALPKERGRFAPLLGMVSDEAQQAPHAIDFLHPRRAPEPQSNRRAVGLALTGAALFLLAGAFWIWSGLSALDQQIDDLKQASTEADQLAKRAGRYVSEVEEISKWTVSDIPWLDEIDRLARQMPPAEAAMLLRLRCGATPEGGRMDVEGLVGSTSDLEAMEIALRDQTHHPESKGSQQYDEGQRYKWWFSGTIHIDGPQAEPAGEDAAPAGTSRPTTAPLAAGKEG